jgi:hypothetical protein
VQPPPTTPIPMRPQPAIGVELQPHVLPQPAVESVPQPQAPPKKNIHNLPWLLFIVIFSLIPALVFVGVGLVEDSFTLNNEGVSVDLNEVQWPITESDGRYYIIVDSGTNNYSGIGDPSVPVHNLSTYQIDQSGNVSEIVLDGDAVGWLLNKDYSDELERCPKEIIESCVVTNNGILEDPIFLGYFPAVALTLIAVRPLIRGFNRISQTTSSRLVILQGEEGGDSELTEGDLRQLTIFQTSLTESLLPWGSISQKDLLTRENASSIRSIRRIPWAISMFGFLFLILGTIQHWKAVDTYGFDIWASNNYLLGFITRLMYEAVLYIVFFPMIFYWLLCSIYLKHQTLTRLEQKKGFRFIRFSHDEAGGMGEFGNQSLRNVVIMLPLLMPIIAYILFYPVTPLLIMGLIIFIIGLPVLFLWPLLGARRSMIRMKELELQMLATHFERSYFQHKNAIKHNPDDLELQALTGGALQQSEQIFQEMSTLPTWPFSKTLIAKFGSIIAMLSGFIWFLIGG